MKTVSSFFIVLCFLSCRVFSDVAPYDQTVDISTSKFDIRVSHHHERHDGAYDSYLRINKKNKEVMIFSPPLTSLFILKEGEFIVGLSNIKFDNNYQLVVWNDEGKEIFKRPIACKDEEMIGFFCTETTTNYVNWYSFDYLLVEGVFENRVMKKIKISTPKHYFCKAMLLDKGLEKILVGEFGAHYVQDLLCENDVVFTEFFIDYSK